MNRYGLLAWCTAGALLLSAPAGAAEFEVKMLNKGTDNQPMVFEPAFLRVQPGDTVKFVSVDKGHNAETIPGMIPDGGESFNSALSQDISVTFKTAGIYGYRCTPHVGMGMVGLIAVGNSDQNLEAARQVKLPPAAAKRMSAFLDQAAKR